MIAGLLGDLADCLGNSIAQLLNQQWVFELLNYLKQQNDAESRNIANWTMKIVQRSIAQ